MADQEQREEESRESDVTKFETASGDEIKLAPGTTWVELFPNTLKVQTGK